MWDANSVHVEQPRGVKSGLFGGQCSLSMKSGKLFYPMLICLDVSEASHHVVDNFKTHQKLHSHTWELRAVPRLVKSIINCAVFKDGKRRNSPLEHTPNQTITFCGNFPLCLIPSFAPASSRVVAHVLSMIDSIDIEQFFIRENNSLCILLTKIRPYPIGKFFLFLLMIITK